MHAWWTRRFQSMCVSRSCRFSAAIDLMCVAVQRFMEAVSHMGTFSRAEEVLDTMLAAVRCVGSQCGCWLLVNALT